MRCAHCYNKIDQQDLVCPHCGNIIETEADVIFSDQDKPEQSKEKPEEKRTKPSRTQTLKEQSKNLGRLFLAHLRNPIKSIQQEENQSNIYGLIALTLLALLNAISFTSLFRFVLSHYDWLSSLSILPQLDISFVPWVFFLKTFVFGFVWLWLIAAMTHFFVSFIFKQKIANTQWLSIFFGINTLSLPVSLLASILSLFAPLLTSIFIVFLLLLELATLLFSIPLLYYMYITKVKMVNNYYSSIITIAVVILAGFLLGNIIY